MLSCKRCGSTFREGDNRTNDKIAAKKALCILLYSLAKDSFCKLGYLLNIPHTQVYRWIRKFGEALSEPMVSGDITEMEFEEMGHFIGKKKENFGSSKRWIVAHGELWAGYSAIVMPPPSDDCMTR